MTQEQLTDTLRRVAIEWEALSLSCSCGEKAACSICEIEFLLEEFTEDQEHD